MENIKMLSYETNINKKVHRMSATIVTIGIF